MRRLAFASTLSFALSFTLTLLSAPARADHEWSSRPSGGSVELLSVWGSGKSDVYAASREGAILHSMDGGKQWESRVPPGWAGFGGFAAIAGRDGDALYAAGGNRVARSVDHGLSWSVVFTGGADDRFAGLYATGASTVVAVGTHGAIVHSEDSGQSWTRSAAALTSDLNAVWGSGEKDLYAAGNGGALLHSDDGGTTWAPLSSGAGEEDLLALWGASKDSVWAVGGGGSILNSKDGGATWTAVWKWDRPLSGVWGVGKSELYVVATTGGLLLHTTDGKKFNQVKSGVSTALHGIWGSGADDVYLVGEGGVILRSGNKGRSFDLRHGIKGAGQESLTAVWGSAADDVYAVGYLQNGSDEKVAHTGEIFHSIDGGASWVGQYRSSGDQPLYAVWSSGPYDVFAAGDGNAILHSKDGGKSWDTQKPGGKGAIRALWGSGPDDVYAVGDKGRIAHSKSGGKSWEAQKAPPAIDLRGVWGASKDDVYAAGIDGDKHELVVLRTTDGGKSWNEVRRAAGATAGGNGGAWVGDAANVWAFAESESSEMQAQHSADQGKTWTAVSAGKGLLHALFGLGAGDLYAASAGGDLLRSADAGKSWQDEKSGTVEALNALWGSHADNVYAVGDKGQILHAAAK